MRTRRTVLSSLLVVLFAGVAAAAPPDWLSKEEATAGFEALADGASLDGWKHAGNWTIENGEIARTGSGGSLVYVKEKVPDDFELRFEWKVAKGSNSGVYYRPGQYEYQILHNAGHSNGTNPRTTAASLYFCMAPSKDVTKPVGEWNTGRIVCQGTVVQHWLNGERVVDFDYTDERWAENVELLRLRGGKLADRGAHLSLQDHGDPVWYRRIRMRPIGPKEDIGHATVTPATVPQKEREAERKKIEGILKRREQSKPKPFTGKKSAWNGYDRFDFAVAGKPVLVVAPKEPAAGRPWVWHGEFFGHKPEPDIALLGRGFHVVYTRIPNMLGCPDAVAHWNKVYEHLVAEHGLAKKVALVGLSRGGLYCYNWAIANPEKVACLYGDAPVCDFKSWPGGRGEGKGSPRDWKLVLQTYGFENEAEALAYEGNPVDNLAPLAKAKVPLLHVYGDADEVVPWDENTGLVNRRYRRLGGQITLIPKPGVGHHPHGLKDPTPIVEFIVKHSLPAATRR